MFASRNAWIALAVAAILIGAAFSAYWMLGHWRTTTPFPNQHITIEGNGEFTEENGVDSGTGTATDPYIIENFDLTFSSYPEACIQVINTSAYFVIRNGHVGFSDPHWSGDIKPTGVAIWISDSSNFTILNLTTRCPARFVNCSDIEVTSNEMNHTEISATDCCRIAITMNNLTRLTMVNCASSTVTDNFLYTGEISLSGSTNCTIERNTLIGGSGISLSGSSNGCEIRYNYMTRTSPGIQLNGVDDCVILGNSIDYGNSWGIDCRGGSRITIQRNEISNCEMHGVVVDGAASFYTIIENNITSCYVGICLFEGYDCEVYHNNLIDNNLSQAWDISIDANVWNATYPQGGNYYSDFAGYDVMQGPGQNITGSDGIGDMEYIIFEEGGEQTADRFPLMQPFVIV